jgi:hypothetical protein
MDVRFTQKNIWWDMITAVAQSISIGRFSQELAMLRPATPNASLPIHLAIQVVNIVTHAAVTHRVLV